MISVAEAIKIIQENIVALPPVKLPLQGASWMVLAEDVYAATDIPAFPQSSMDGYAFSFSGWQSHKKLRITGEIAAGNNQAISLKPENAIRIFTGAPVPSGADTVVMQEKVKVYSSESSEAKLIINDEMLRKGNNVRSKGSEIKAGALALAKDSFLSAPALGFLAGIGISEVIVYPNPTVSIIVTGKELQQPGKPLEYGQVYESNSFALNAALCHLHINNVKVFQADDKLEILTGILQEALLQSDLVLLTGGISAGDYDFVLQASTQCGVTKLFHKIKQRPGKPLYFGKKINKLVFGLPGNPSSVLTCFYEYVIPALEILSKRKISLQKIQVPLAKPFQKAAVLTHFLKGFYDGKTVMFLDAQESYRLSSFAKANCLIKINEEVAECKDGEMVEVHLLPS